jgi:hypothetical protein
VNEKDRRVEARLKNVREFVTLDMLIGAVVFGTVGAAIGYYLGSGFTIGVASAIGVVFGFLIGILGGRRFFISIVCGALAGGGLAGFVAGSGTVPLGAASGGAMGGFLGVQMGMLLELWRESKQSQTPESPVSGNENTP